MISIGMTSDWPCDVTADQLTTDPLRYAQTSMFVLIVESFDLSLESERDLKLSTNKQLKRQRCWLTANQPSQQPTTWESVHFQCPVNLQDLYLSGQATKSQGSTEHSCWGTSGITRGQDWPGMWWEYTWLINRWVVNTCREQGTHVLVCAAADQARRPGLGLASPRTQPIH